MVECASRRLMRPEAVASVDRANARWAASNSIDFQAPEHFRTRVRRQNVNTACRPASCRAREMGWLPAPIEEGGYLRCVPERTDILTAREPFTWAFLAIMTMDERAMSRVRVGRTGPTFFPRVWPEAFRALPSSWAGRKPTAVGVVRDGASAKQRAGRWLRPP